MTNVIPVAATAYVVTSVAKSLFPGQPQEQASPARRSSRKKQKRFTNKGLYGHPGNFSNLGF